jgi:hypothetical protein
MRSQIRINEVSSASVSTFLDEDGDQEDWIELYNSSGVAIDLEGFKISRKEEGKTKSWTFPSIIIKPYAYLTIFCSEKNRKAYFDHWEVPVYANDYWKYFPGTMDPPATWRSNTFNDAGWPTGQGGIGYGDGDDSTVTAPLYSVFMRKSFNIADTSKIPTAALLIDYDDAFVAYLNDVEIARSNIGVYGDHPAYNTSAYDEHEALMYQTGDFSGGYFVSPEVMDSALRPGNNVFSIQVHNYSGGLDDLSAIPYLLIGVNDTAVTYFPFAATVNLHTDFNLNSTGQEITLLNALGTIEDQHTIPAMQINHSYGRRPDGSSTWAYFDVPTPTGTNNASTYYNGYAGKPVFTLPAGFYTGPQTVGISAGSGVIRYTLDGTDPNNSSPLFTAPLTIDSTTVVRARVYSSSPLDLPGEIITNTYFINENISLPVVALTSDPVNLFDHNYGIYVFGPNADTTTVPFFGSNFWQGWERPANIEFFDDAGVQGFETPSAISIQGNYSKAWPQRGFSVKAKENYNGSAIEYPLFPSKPHITEYKSFNIRNAGSDWNTCHMRDRFNQKTVQGKTDIDIMDGRPCVLFINGKYWGVYELRERQDKNYIESNTGVSADKIDFLEFDGNIIEGSNEHFLDMAAMIGTSNMALPANYAQVKNMLDIENFVDYFATETFVMNIDWLGSYTNNIKFWRPNKPAGKWRYMLWDTDLSLGFAEALGTGQPEMNMLSLAIDPTTPNPHSTMLKGLLENTEFRHYFVNRYADLMNTIFQPSEMQERAYALRDEMLPEMTRHFNRWGMTSTIWGGFIGRSTDVPSWNNEIDTMLQWSSERIGHARDQVEAQFALTKQVDVTLNVYPEGAGKIHISTITPESLPWTGVYFDGVPVTMTVEANPGFQFTHWQSNYNVTTPFTGKSLTLNISSDDTFTAYFEQLEDMFEVYPNPFDDQLTFVYTLPEDKQVSIRIYNSIGQLVAEPVSDGQYSKAGTNTITIDPGSKLNNGIYFVEMRSADLNKTVKLVRSRVE